MTDGPDVLARVLNGRELARISRQPPSARKRGLGVPAAGRDLPLLHDCSTSGDDEYVGEVDRSTDRVGATRTSDPSSGIGASSAKLTVVVLRHRADPRVRVVRQPATPLAQLSRSAPSTLRPASRTMSRPCRLMTVAAAVSATASQSAARARPAGRR